MKTSLKTSLYNLIKGKGYLSFEEMTAVCKDLGYRVSNGERRMRELTDGENAQIEKVMSEKGYIKAYKWKSPRMVWLPAREPKQVTML